MTRTIFAVVAALFIAAGLLPSGATACISCNYKPAVIDTPVNKPAASKKPRIHKADKARRSVKKKVAKPRQAPAKTETVETKAADTENKSSPVENQAVTEPTDSSTVAMGNSTAKPADEPAATSTESEIGCKRFSPTAGVTIPVPCE